MWYFSWILGLLLACSLGVINVMRLEAQEMLERENLTLDPLTKLMDRNAFNERLRQKIENSRRNGFPFSLVFLSLAPVKQAHPGISQSDMDSIIWGVVDILKQELRLELDILSRFGFEEFAIVLPGATEQLALETAEHIQKSIKERVTIVDEVTIETLAGVSEYPKQIVQTHGDMGLSIMEDVEDMIMFTCAKFVSV